jgi:hypothetical protein
MLEPADYLSFALAHFHKNPNSLKSRLCKPIIGEMGFVFGIHLERELIRKYLSNVKTEMGKNW